MTIPIPYENQADIKNLTGVGDEILYVLDGEPDVKSGRVREIDPFDDRIVVENIDGEDGAMEYQLTKLTFYQDIGWDDGVKGGTVEPAYVALGDSAESEHIHDRCVICRDASVKKTTKGAPYLSCTLADSTSELPAKMWSFPETAEAFNNKVCVVSGRVESYKASKQVIIDAIRLASKEEVELEMEHLVPTAPTNFTTDHFDVLVKLDSIQDEDFKHVCTLAVHKYWDRFQNMPAAEKVHHAFIHGLLMHTANMMRVASFIGETYRRAGLRIDMGLLMTGVFLHDIGKIAEYTLNDLGLVEAYSVQGCLIGHPVLGAMDVAELAASAGIPEEKKLLLMHMLLSHHGEPEWGAAVRPMCVEAEILSKVDMLDAQMEIFRELQDRSETGAFSAKEFLLGNRRIYFH